MYCWLLILPAQTTFRFQTHLTSYGTYLFEFSAAISNTEWAEYISYDPYDPSPVPPPYFLLSLDSIVSHIRNQEIILEILLLSLVLHLKCHKALMIPSKSLKSIYPSMHPVHVPGMLSLMSVARSHLWESEPLVSVPSNSSSKLLPKWGC